VYMTCTQKADA